MSLLKVQICGTPKCEKKITPSECHWNQEEDPGQCYSLHSMCVDKGASECHWARTTLLKKCLETVEQDGRLQPHHGRLESEYSHHDSHHNDQQQIEFNHNVPHDFEP